MVRVQTPAQAARHDLGTSVGVPDGGTSALAATVASRIDAALGTMQNQMLVSTSEVADLLLDLRSALQEQIRLDQARAASVIESTGRSRRPRLAISAATWRAARRGPSRRARHHLPRVLRSR